MRSPTVAAAIAAVLAVLALLVGPVLVVGAFPAAAQETQESPAPAPSAAPMPRRGVAVTAGTRDGRSRLTVALPATAAPSGPGAFVVTVDGRPQPTDAVPLLSDTTATTVVVDASAAGAPVLQPGLSGAASFVLATPPAARSALVVDTAPPAVVSPLQVGPADTLRGLAAVRPAGSRQTGVAVELALDQLPHAVDGPHLVLLYTGAPDAMGLPAADLVAHLHAAGAVLAVVVPGTGGTVPPYWSAVAAASGGVAVAAGDLKIISAFDALGTALRTRWLVTFPAPPRLPAVVVVHVDTVAGQVAAAVDVPPATAATGAAASGAAGRANSGVDLAFGLVLLAALVAGVVVAVLRRPGRSGAADDAAAPEGAGDLAAGDPEERAAWNIPDRPHSIADRPRLAAEVRRALQAGGRVVLQPEGGAIGMGTTTAMVELAHRDRADHDIAWWVPAADPPLVADRLAELAEVLGLAAPTDPADVAADRLLAALGRRGRWLLIFDDAAGPRQLGRFLPPGGRILIGSSDPEWTGHATPVPVPRFTRPESTGLLRDRCPGLAAAEADRLAAALDDAPPAVHLAAATLVETGMSVATYLPLLAENAGPEHGERASGRPDPRPDADDTDGSSTAAACAIALDRLGANGPTALTLLTLLAWLGPEAVPLSLLHEYPGQLPAPLAHAGLHDLLAGVARRGLARLDGPAPVGTPADTAGRTVTLPPAVARVLIARSSGTGIGGAGWAALAVRLLRAAVPADPADPAGWPAWRRLLPHVLAVTDPGRPLDDVPAEVGGLLRDAACYLRARGEQRAARALFEDAYDLYRRRLGPDHPDTLAAARTLADGDDEGGAAGDEHRVLHDADAGGG